MIICCICNCVIDPMDDKTLQYKACEDCVPEYELGGEG